MRLLLTICALALSLSAPMPASASPIRANDTIALTVGVTGLPVVQFTQTGTDPGFQTSVTRQVGPDATGAKGIARADIEALTLGIYAHSSSAVSGASAIAALSVAVEISGPLNVLCSDVIAVNAPAGGCAVVGYTLTLDGSLYYSAESSLFLSLSPGRGVPDQLQLVSGMQFPVSVHALGIYVPLTSLPVGTFQTFQDTILMSLGGGVSTCGPPLQGCLESTADFLHTAALSFGLPQGTTLSTNYASFVAQTPTSVPEPSTLALLGVGAACLLVRRRRRSGACFPT
jgi:hypothetical protein